MACQATPGTGANALSQCLSHCKRDGCHAKHDTGRRVANAWTGQASEAPGHSGGLGQSGIRIGNKRGLGQRHPGIGFRHGWPSLLPGHQLKISPQGGLPTLRHRELAMMLSNPCALLPCGMRRAGFRKSDFGSAPRSTEILSSKRRTQVRARNPRSGWPAASSAACESRNLERNCLAFREFGSPAPRAARASSGIMNLLSCCMI